ncbi:MAG: sigma-70 family RNA polymerase sigma factor [Myxococcus sp.]|nr:sigma-70 family RNA polymerase sigma factor [Myxococcus sp.]
MPEPENSEVVLRAQRGDRKAVEALVRRYLRPAYLVALSVVRVPAEAEDVAQEAVAMAMQRLEDCRDPARFSGWLMTNVRNRGLNRLAAAKVRQRHVDAVLPDEAQDSDAARVAVRQTLLAALETLTPQQREVVLLHDLESWTHAEIAESLGLSEVNSRQVLSVARRTLRAKLNELEGPTHG